MKAVLMSRFGGPEVLEYVSTDPPELGVGEVRVRLEASGVNPAETYIRTGEYAFFQPPLPCTLGFDGAGYVQEIDSEAASSGLAVGDRVFVSCLHERRRLGTYAEQVVCRPSSVHPLPDHLDFEAGAAVGVPMSTAWRAVHQLGGVVPSDLVLVHGASGAVGLPAVQLAVAAGATVIGTAGSARGEAAVRTAGARHVLRHDLPGYLDGLQDLTEGHGVDLVVEMLADVNLARDLEELAPFGRVIVVGSRGSLYLSPRRLMVKEATVRGTALWNCRPGEWAELTAGVATALRERVLQPVVGEVFPLSAAAEAHRFLLEAPSAGKVVLRRE